MSVELKSDEEIIAQILESLDFKSLKCCHLVCKKWYRIATPDLFRVVILHAGNSSHFTSLLARQDLSQFVTLVSVGNPADMMFDDFETSRKSMQLYSLPRTGLVRQMYGGKFTICLREMVLGALQPIFPALKKIQLKADDPYMALVSFKKLEKITFDMEQVRLRVPSKWPNLISICVRGDIDFDALQSFLCNHTGVRRVQVQAISKLRARSPQSSYLPRLIRSALATALSPAFTDSILDQAEKYAESHERTFVRAIHAELDKQLEANKAKEMHSAIVVMFQTILEFELKKNSKDIMTMRVPLRDLSLLELRCAIEYYWEDSLAITNERLRDDSQIHSGSWAYNGNEEGLPAAHSYVMLDRR